MQLSSMDAMGETVREIRITGVTTTIEDVVPSNAALMFAIELLELRKQQDASNQSNRESCSSGYPDPV
jgi:hypothetical protein